MFAELSAVFGRTASLPLQLNLGLRAAITFSRVRIVVALIASAQASVGYVLSPIDNCPNDLQPMPVKALKTADAKTAKKRAIKVNSNSTEIAVK